MGVILPKSTGIIEKEIERFIEFSDKILDLKQCLITDEVVKIFAEALGKNKILTEINLCHNEITDEGAKYIAEALVKNQTLTKINLCHNEIANEGVFYLAEALEKNKTLTVINLSNNKITEEGAKYLAEALVKNKTLTELSLSWNNITDTGAKYLAEALEKNQTLTEIDLWVNKISYNLQLQIYYLIQRNKDLQKIPTNLENNSKNENENFLNLLENYKIDIKEIKFILESNGNKRLYGKGAFRNVFLAKYKGTKVEVKKICKHLEDKEEIIKELELMTKFRHPNINTLIAYSEDEHYFYMITEYFKLGNLFEVLNNNDIHLKMRKKLEILHQIASAIRYLHELNPPVLHKDIKSHNVLVSDKVSKAYLTDFSLCNEELTSSLLREIHSEEGSIRWIAPELFIFNKYEPSSDVYSFGILMWEVLTRKLPFEEMKEDYEVMKCVVEGGRPNLKELPKETHRDLITIMKKCWDQEPVMRPSLEEITDVFDQICD